MIVLIINYKLSNCFDIKKIYKNIWDIENNFKFCNPLLETIFLNLAIQVRLLNLDDHTLNTNDNKIASQLDCLMKFVDKKLENPNYNYVVNFDRLIG